jgi:RNA polymerase sigma-70 factor (TIGR02943 family)
MLGTNKQDIFSSWINDHSDVLFYYALKHRLDEQDAKDIVQETFLSAWRGMDNYREQSSACNWLFAILKNKITDHFRKAINRINFVSLETEHNDHTFFDEHDHWKKGMYPEPWSVDFNNPADVNDFRRIFKNCTGKLKQIQSIVFIMKYVDNLEGEKICKELGITPSNYWVILHRAKVQLRACLEKNWLTN